MTTVAFLRLRLANVHGRLLRCACSSAYANAEIRPQYRAAKRFLRTDTARMIVAHESTGFAATGALKCRTLW
jgi:hypothetical protein